MTSKSIKTSFTLTGIARDILARQAAAHGVSQTALLEMLIRALDNPRISIGIMVNNELAIEERPASPGSA